jgi:hypothetical protein
MPPFLFLGVISELKTQLVSIRISNVTNKTSPFLGELLAVSTVHNDLLGPSLKMPDGCELRDTFALSVPWRAADDEPAAALVYSLRDLAGDIPEVTGWEVGIRLTGGQGDGCAQR